MNKNKYRIFSWALILLPLILILCRFASYYIEDEKIKKISSIAASYTVEAPAVNESGSYSAGVEDFIDIGELKSINPDTAGFLKVRGTEISYPVMRSEEEDKYLKRDFYGKKSIYGSIYIDNASYKHGTNMVLYGHNMKSGKMFGELKSYRDEDFAREHSEIRFITNNEIRVYELGAVFSAPADEEELIRNLIPYRENELENLVEYIKKREGKFYQELSWGDELITLATCEYNNKNGRLFIIGRLSGVIRRKEI